MNPVLTLAWATTLGATLGAAVLPNTALAADNTKEGREQVSEARSIDARVVRVRLDGIIDLKIRQGAVAQLVLTGERRMVGQTTTVQSGDTLTIDNDEDNNEGGKGKSKGKVQLNFNSRHMLHAELTLPRLRELRSDSVGSTEVTGFNGDELDLSLDGAGMMKVVADYKVVTASLGGIGNMNIQSGNLDRIDLNLHGAGYVTLSGRTKLLKASLGGVGGLDAEKFQAETVQLDMSGLGSASVLARQNASLNLSGLGSVTVYGKPAGRSVSVDGLGKVSWK
jgi:hypothetical protein